MNFWNVTVLVLTFLAPVAAVLLASWGGGKRADAEQRGCMLLFALAMVTAAAGVVRFDRPVRMEFLWPLTLEQSGYFEFTLQLFWTRYVWIFFAAAMVLCFVAYEGSKSLRRGGLFFLTGTFLSLVLLFLSENILLSLFFAEIAAFTAHVFELEDTGESERAAYFKRSCFLFLGLLALLAVALSRQLASSSVMLLGVVLYLSAFLFSRHVPEKWSQVPVLLIGLATALFLLERVMADEISSELWLPLAGIFAIGTTIFACLSLVAPASIGASFWLICSCLGYLLYLRFNSAKPGDPFWGAYEAIGLGAAFAISQLMRFGGRMDLFWKRVAGFVFLALTLVVISGALPTVEAATIRFDADTSLPRIALFGFLTFLIAAVSGRGFSLALTSEGGKEDTSGLRGPVGIFGPAVLVVLVQVGMLLRWSELNFDGIAAGGLTALVAEPRALLALAGVAAGLLSGGLLGTNNSFAAWTRKRDPRMENFFPAVDSRLIQSGITLLQAPEQAAGWASSRLAANTDKAAGMLESADRTMLGERLFRRFADSSVSLSEMVRAIHSGQARTYLFLGVLFTLLASAAFLWEGR